MKQELSEEELKEKELREQERREQELIDEQQTAELVQALPQALLCWYSFQMTDKVLYIGEVSDAYYHWLESHCGVVEVVAEQDSATFCQKSQGGYDYVVAIGKLSYAENPSSMVAQWKSVLTPKGRLLLGFDNRLGIKYFCGEKDPISQRSFDGVENYRRFHEIGKKNQGKLYSKEEITKMLEVAGCPYTKFYAVFPTLELPQLFYADGYLPEEELTARYFPFYNSPDTVFLEEQFLYKDLIGNGMFHALANAYFVECSMVNEFESALQVTTSMDRGHKNAMATIITEQQTVVKRILYPEQQEKLVALDTNLRRLQERGIEVVKGTIEGDSFVMPYIKGKNLITHMRELFYEDRELFIQEMDKIRDVVLQSSDVVDVDGELGPMLREGYYDLTPVNAIVQEDGTFCFFDQEFCVPNYPANLIIQRVVFAVYVGESTMSKLLPLEFFYERYGFQKALPSLKRMEGEFYAELRNLRLLNPYYQTYKIDPMIVHGNRQRISLTAKEYASRFYNPLQGVGNKKLIVFGAGKFAKEFVQLYKQDYNITSVIDNKEEIWGEELEGILIQSPTSLLEECDYKVIICVKNYLPITIQLQGMQVEDYGIYDPNANYKLPRVAKSQSEDGKNKKYKVGYVAGVFDMFHIGHLNLIRRAKERCDYLIVGVVTDEGVVKYKGIDPFVPLVERLEIVDSCKYVDQAVEIPVELRESETAHRLYQFDCQFLGSDYAESEYWLLKQKLLRELGSELEFFPYTETISSSQLREQLNKDKVQYDKKVSIVVPVYNVEDYLEECLDSVLRQSLVEIEVICVDDGSTDNSGEILDEYAKRDPRVRVIHKENSGYGHAVNIGMDHAKGEYIGIVESDDYIHDNMYEILYEKAVANNLDLIKANYATVYTDEQGESHESEVSILPKEYGYEYDMVVDVSQRGERYPITLPSTWAGIYRNEFLQKYQIRHNESPGASYQDIGFYHATTLLSKRSMYIEESLYRYRIDREGASMQSDEKVYTTHKEWQYVTNYLRQFPEVYNHHIRYLTYSYFRAIHTNFTRIRDEFIPDLIRFLKEFIEELKVEGIYSPQWYVSPKKEFYEQLEIDVEKAIEMVLTQKKQFHKENARVEELMSLSSKVVIYGAGVYGRKLYDTLIPRFPIKHKISCFAVTESEAEQQQIGKVPVYSLESIANQDSLIIIAVSPNKVEVAREMKRHAISVGFHKIVQHVGDLHFIEIE